MYDLIGADVIYDEDGNEISGYGPEVGRRRGLRRLGRGLGAVFTGGLSEVAIARRQAARAKQVARRALAAAPPPSLPQTAGHGLVAGRQRQAILPLGSVGLNDASPVGQLFARVERPMQGQRLQLSSSAIDDFVVTQINVGVRLQQAAVGEHPASIYAPTALQSGLQMDPLGVGVGFTVGLRYTGLSSAPITISGALVGVASD